MKISFVIIIFNKFETQLLENKITDYYTFINLYNF